mgnify:CR=1 FL=1
MDTLASVPFRAFTEKAKIEGNAVSGEDNQTLVERIRKTPRGVIEATRRNISTD